MQTKSAPKIQSGLITLCEIPIDTKIICPRCRTVIGKTRVTIPTKTTIQTKYFEWAKPFEFLPGQALICPMCPEETWWVRSGHLYTTKGWMPGKTKS